MEEQQLIEQLHSERAKDDSNTRTLANTVRSIISDTLSGDKYLSELLQNADDAKSTSVEFILTEGYLIVKHKGNHFGRDDVKAICDAASPERAKVKASDHIGNKGIGFKAVFSMASTVTIISNRYSFRFDESYTEWKEQPNHYPWQIIPIWTDKQSLADSVKPYCDDNSVHFILRLREEVIPEIGVHLDKLNSRYLLFLRHVKTMTCVIKSNEEEKNDVVTETTLQAPHTVFQSMESKDDFTISQIKINQESSWNGY